MPEIGDLVRAGQAESRPGSGRGYAVRMSVFYGALFLIMGVHIPFLPVWLNWRGLSANEIAVIVSAPHFLRLIVTPSAALLADRSDGHRRMVIGLAWACLVLAAILSQMQTFWMLFLVAVGFHLAASTIMPLTETVAVRGVKAANLDYGRMRLWGSITFIIAGLGGGACMDAFGPVAAVWLLVFGACATALAAHQLPRPSRQAAGAHSTSTPGIVGADAVRVVRAPLFAMFLLAVGLIQATHATFYAFGAVHWGTQGISTQWIGTLWAISIIAEVALFAYSRRVLSFIGPVELILAGGLGAVVRWSIMCFDPTLSVLVPLQVLHALTYGASHLGAIHFISRAIPESASGTAQALYATFAAGVFMGAVTLISGPIYSAYGGMSYVVPAVLGAVGTGLTLWIRGKWDGGPLWTSEQVTAGPSAP